MNFRLKTHPLITVLLPHVCFLLPCFELWRSVPPRVEYSFISFLFLCSAVLATPLLTKQRQGTGLRSLFGAFREFVCMIWRIILGLPNQQPSSQHSARMQGTARVSCSSPGWRVWSGKEKRFWLSEQLLCQTAYEFADAAISFRCLKFLCSSFAFVQAGDLCIKVWKRRS